MFLALLKLILALAACRRLKPSHTLLAFCDRTVTVIKNVELCARAKMSLSRAKNIFMPANINSIVILYFD